MMRTTALIMAAGRGMRAGGEIPKQYQMVGDISVLRHTLQRFLRHPAISATRVVIHPEDLALYNQATAGLDLPAPVPGGDSRQQSVRLGLEALVPDRPDRVLIHDAARPFVDDATINAVLQALDGAVGAIAAIRMTDTVKRSTGDFITQTVPRADLWRAQTPQGFHFQALLDAYRKADGMEMTDDASVAEHAGLAVQLVPSSEANFKITTRVDFIRAETILGNRAMFIRIGQGFDVHRFEPGQSVMLCGVAIAHDKKLAGHSDADVALHALTDAILGAIAQGDIGQHFPPSDPKWKGAASHLFLQHAGGLVREAGGEILNLDVTIICEAPRIGPHRAAMQQRIEQILDLPAGSASVKATTTEGLGFTGRGEGIAAQAIASVRLPR